MYSAIQGDQKILGVLTGDVSSTTAFFTRHDTGSQQITHSHYTDGTLTQDIPVVAYTRTCLNTLESCIACEESGVQWEAEESEIDREEGWISRSIPSDLAHMHIDEENDDAIGDHRTEMDARQEIDRGEGWIGRSIPAILVNRHSDNSSGAELGGTMDTDK